MNEATVLITNLIEHYDAVELLRHAAKLIAVLLVLLLIQTSRAAFHRGKYESFKKTIKEMKRRMSSYCEEITWHRDNGERLEARLFKDAPTVAETEEA